MMAGMDPITGGLLDGWPRVADHIMRIFTTGYGQRILRMWWGSNVPQLLGENMTENTVVRFFMAIITSMEIVENGLPRMPNFKITKLTPKKVERPGSLTIEIVGIYMPRGHLGDFAPEDVRTLTIPLFE
jgi:phage baseplate assembly protein W